MSRPFRLPVLCLLTAACLAGAPAAGQDSARNPGTSPDAVAGRAPSAQVFTDEISVELVTLAVKVIDRKGRPVSGLEPEAFHLFVDGQEVEITHFAEVDDGPAPGPGRTGEETAQALPAPALRAPGHHVVLFVDDAHLAPGGRRQVLADLRTFVEEELSDRDRVMLAVHGNGLRLVEPFTADRERVAEAIARLAEEAPSGARSRVERRRVLRRMLDTLLDRQGEIDCSTANVYQAEAIAREHAQLEGSDALQSLGALERLIAALAGLPGRSATVVVSDGLPQRPGIDLFLWLADTCPAREREIATNYLSFDLSSSYLDTAAHANANRVILYTLEAGGGRQGSDIDLGPGVRISTRGHRARTANLQSPLFLLADETGGEAVLNANRFAGELAEIYDDLESYYSLGFDRRPEMTGDDHLIRVEVEGRGLQARHPKSFLDKSFEQRLGERMLSTLMFGGETNPLGVEVAIGDAQPAAEGRMEVPVRIRVPLDRLSLVRASGGASGQLRLVLATRDSSGDWTEVRQKVVAVDAEGVDPQDPTGESVFEVTVEILPGEATVAVGVHDDVGERTSSLRRSFVVPAAEEG